MFPKDGSLNCTGHCWLHIEQAFIARLLKNTALLVELVACKTDGIYIDYYYAKKNMLNFVYKFIYNFLDNN